jgi:SPP1 gp7 family putative phage head morphogenesis protein
MKIRTRKRRLLANSFCRTGEGGGVDPTCSPGGGDHDKLLNLSGHVSKGLEAWERERATSENPYKHVESTELVARHDLFLKQLNMAKSDGRDEDAAKWKGKIENAREEIDSRKTYYSLQRQKSAIDEGIKTGKLTVTEGEMAKILSSKGDVYHDAGIKSEGGRYPHAPELFRTSDLSGAKIRHYVTLPDGRIAHPDELIEARQRGRLGIIGQDVKLPPRDWTTNTVANTRWMFHDPTDKVKAFQAWLKRQTFSLISNETEEERWKRYIQEGFAKGAGRAFDDVRMSKLGKEHPELFSAEAQQSVSDFYRGTREEFLRSSFAQPESIEKVRLLADRTFDELKNVTEDMSNRMSRSLTDGLVQGKHPLEIAKDMNEEVDLGEYRAETVALTELIKVHAEAQLDAFEQLGVEEVGAALEFATADDDSVCPECAALDGVVLTVEEARGIIPLHPRDRCCWLPANVGEDDSDQKDTKAQIDKALEESGADIDVEISSDRPESILNTANERGSFFADCPRDELGHCLPAGGSSVVKGDILRAAQAQARDKGSAIAKPSKEDIHAANERINSLGADRYESQIRGNSTDRANSRDRLLKEFGDGHHCPCIYCGLKLGKDTVTRDKIITARQGGRYKNENLVPACLACNQARGDTKWENIRWQK